MVKKPKTPELPEEVKYYTCYKPYPNNADFEQTADHIKFCRWISNALGSPLPLYAVYYKPRSRGMVIFSVDKTYPRPERLLGEHRYSEFLKKPDRGEENLISQIFYSTYSTERDVQKDGWKCIPVEDFFFANYGIDNWFTKVVYPAPHWCATPTENMTEKSLCRTIPKSQVSRPLESPAPAAPRPVVGSSAWAERQNPNPQRNPPAGGVGRGRANPQQRQPPGAPGSQSNRASSQTSFPPLSPASPTASRSARAPLLSPPAANSQLVWQNKPSNVKAATGNAPLPGPSSAVRPGRTNNKRSKSQAGTSGKATPSTASPSTSSTVQPRGGKNPSAPRAPPTKGGPSKSVNKVNSLTRATLDKLSVPGTPRRSGGSSSSSTQTGGSGPPSAVSSAPSSPLLSSSVNLVYDYDNDFDEEITDETYHETWETASIHEPSEASAPAVRVGYRHPAEEEVTERKETENLWIGVTTDRPTGSMTAAEAHAKASGKLICPIHKGKCRAGICEEFKELQRLEKKKKKKQEREMRRKQAKQAKEKAAKKGNEDSETHENGESSKEKATTPIDNANEGGQQEKKDTGGKKRWADYSSDDDDDDFGYTANFTASKGSGGKKFLDDEEFFD